MLYGFGISFLVAGSFCTFVTNRWMFLGHKPFVQASIFDITDFFWYLQWTGIWCGLASLLLFAVDARLTPYAWTSLRALAPGLAIALSLLFLATSMPEETKQREWYRGELGVVCYVRTKFERREGVEGAPRRLGGKWKSSDGARVEIWGEKVFITSQGETTELSERTCPQRFFFTYEMPQRMELGIHFFRAGVTSEALYSDLPDRRYTILRVLCGEQETAFILIDKDRLVGVLGYGQWLLLTR
jgi:hypothetical protein